MTVKDHELLNFLGVIILLNFSDFQNISGMKTRVHCSYFSLFFPLEKEADSLHWGGNLSLPKMMATLPGDTIQGWRSGQRKRCPHVAVESTLSPVHQFDK